MRKIQIKCVLDDTLILGLGSLRENMGHDDSIPYQAGIFVARKGTKSTAADFVKVGTVCNSGWGGDSEIHADFLEGRGRENIAELDRLDELCKAHSVIYRGSVICKYSLGHLCDCMAENYLYSTPEAKKLDLLYKFDDDPMVIAHPRKQNIFVIKHK